MERFEYKSKKEKILSLEEIDKLIEVSQNYGDKIRKFFPKYKSNEQYNGNNCR